MTDLIKIRVGITNQRKISALIKKNTLRYAKMNGVREKIYSMFFTLNFQLYLLILSEEQF